MLRTPPTERAAVPVALRPDRISLVVLRPGSELAGVPFQRDGIDPPGEVVVSVLSDDVAPVVDLHRKTTRALTKRRGDFFVQPRLSPRAG